MTSSPAPTPQARSARYRASVPEPTPIACSTPQYAASSASNDRTFGPSTSSIPDSTSSIAARISGWSARYWAFRSTNGTCMGWSPLAAVVVALHGIEAGLQDVVDLGNHMPLEGSG